MLHELRIYHCAPNKLPALSKRFETITTKLWDKHGIRPVCFWTVVIGTSNSDFYYLLEWEDLAERERRWNAFATDPEWLAAKAETEKDGALLTHFSNTILAPTAYSNSALRPAVR